MAIRSRLRRGWAAAGRPALVMLLAVPWTAAGWGPAGGGPSPARGAVHAVSRSAQREARAFWTPARMAAATPLAGGRRGDARRRPRRIPSPTRFSGVPAVGALFFTTGRRRHFCTASVVTSTPGDLVLTAAHCVYQAAYVSNVEFVPRYHTGQQPFGAWAVRAIVVPAGWRRSHGPGLDFAFLAVTPPAGTQQPIQHLTGGLRLGVRRGYRHRMEVIGYNDTDSKPLKCATRSFLFRARHMKQPKFYCNDYWNGTSGGPWISGRHRRAGTGTVFGIIGGYQQGGRYPWASYSPYFGPAVARLFQYAEQLPGQQKPAG